jgi:hypothetical protein
VLIGLFSFSRDYTGICVALLLRRWWEGVCRGWVLRELLWGDGDTWRISKSVRIIVHKNVVIVLATFIVSRM